MATDAMQFHHWFAGRHGLYVRIALVIISALLCAASFPPLRIGWLMWLALAPFFIALHRADVRTSFWLSFLFGMLYFGIPLHWFKNIFGIACIGVYVLGAIGPILFGIARSLVERVWGATVACVLTPVLWVGAEFFQSELWYFHFSWLQVGLSQVPYLPVIQIASVVGAYGLSFIIVLFNALLALAFTIPALRKRNLAFACTLFIIMSFVTLWGWVTLNRELHQLGDINVGVVQDESSHLDTLIERTAEFTPSSVQLIVYPEYALMEMPLSDPSLLRRLQSLAKRYRATLVIGCKVRAPDDAPLDWLRTRAFAASNECKFYNAALVLAPDGRVLGTYHKANPIPLFLDGVPGRKIEPIATPVGMLGIAICYDLGFSLLIRRLVARNAELLVVPAYDALHWGRTEHVQHAAVTIMRAVEMRRFIVRAASSGISQIVDPYGRVLGMLEFGDVGTMQEQVSRWHIKTLYVRMGYLLPYLCLGGYIIACLVPAAHLATSNRVSAQG